MTTIMGFQDVSEIVEKGLPKLTDSSIEAQRVVYKESKKKDYNAIFLLYQCVDEAHFEKISEVGSPKEAWEICKKSNEGVKQLKKVRLQTMRRQYELMQMELGERIAEFFNRIISYTNAMKVSESKKIEELKIVDLQGSLEAHEQRFIERSMEKSADQALQAYTSRRGGYDNKWGQRSRGRGKEQKMGNFRYPQFSDQERSDSDKVEQSSRSGGYQRWQGNKKKVDKKKLKCFNCDKIGHFSNECQSNPSHGGNHSKHNNKVHLAKKESIESLDDEPVLLMMTTDYESSSDDRCLGQLVENGFLVQIHQGVLEIFDVANKKILRVPLAQNKNFQVSLRAIELIVYQLHPYQKTHGYGT
ncbi:PREDICTED: uncharacterized protein LOC109358031 [Lupinus angustifolius]|uniref:uncharacterized protein LOC109358031 n=1 Tax=Lupinus angustifolius TaxID=3871 RepID=UPI00092F42C7|nr:PREDICTED: uncharacterized protein LOC109358031 [Lupinus angustifolius]